MATDPTMPLVGETTDLVDLRSVVRPRWERRAALVMGEIRAAKGQERQAALWAELGRIQEQRLGRTDLAARSYERSLSLAPSAQASWGLVRLAAQAGDWASCDGSLARLATMPIGDAALREVRRLRDEIVRANGRRPEPGPSRLAVRVVGSDDDEEDSTAVAEAPPPVTTEPLPEDTKSALARARSGARATTDRRLGAAILLRAAMDLRLRGDLEAAAELVDDAARLAPTDDAVLDAHARLARDRKDWGEFARILVTRADNAGTGSVATSARSLAALTLRIAVGDPAAAALLFARVPETDADPWTLSRAATELAAGLGLPAAERLGAAAAGARSPRIAAILQLAAAESAREAGRHDVALARLADAARLQSGSGLSARRVLAAHEARQEWASVVSLLDTTTAPGEVGAAARARAARVCVRQIGDRATAETHLRASLRQWPAGVGARLALEGIFIAEGRMHDLDALVAEEEGFGSFVPAWRRLWLRRSGRIEAPAETVAHAAILAGREKSMRARWTCQTLLAEQERWAALVEALSEEAGLGAGRRTGCLLRLVRVRARIDAADDVAVALGMLLGPDDDRRLLGRLYERLCYASGHIGGLIDRWALRLEERPDARTRARLAFLCLLGVDSPGRPGAEGAPPTAERLTALRVASMCLDKLRDDTRGWIAIRPIAQLVAAEIGSWSDVHALMLDEIDAASAPTFWTLLTVAEIAENRLGDTGTAIVHLERAEAQRRGHPAVLRNLQRLYRHTERWTALESLLIAQARRPADVPALPWLARLAVTDLELRRDDSRAVSSCSAILRDHPAFAPALRGAERLLAQHGKFGELAAVWARAAEALDGPARTFALRAAADATTLAPSDDAAEIDRGQLLREIVAADPADRGARLEVADAELPGPEHAAARARALEACVPHAPGPSDRMLLLTQIADERVASGDPLLGIPSAEEGLQADVPCHLGALLALAGALVARTATEAASAVRLAVVLEAVARECRTRDNRKDALTFAARLFQADPSRQEDALRCTRGVIALDPKNPDALTRLVTLRSARGEWRELVDELGAIVAADPVAPDTIVLLEQIAFVQREHLGALEEAAATCDAILAQNPRHATAMLWRAQAHAARRAWSDAALGFEAVLQVVSGPERVPALRELAALYHDRVASPGRAQEILEELVAAEPDEIVHLRKLSDVLFGDRKWQAAEQIAVRIVARERDAEPRIEALVRLAQIREHGFRDPPGAVEWYARALEVDPIRQATVDELSACLKRAGDLQGVQAYRRQFSMALRERLHDEPTRIAWWRRFAESLAQRGLDLPCELASSMIDWLESRGAAGRDGRPRHLDPDGTRAVVRTVGVPAWALFLLPRLEQVLRSEYEWEPKKLGVKRSDRITTDTGHPLFGRVQPVAASLGLAQVEIIQFPVAGGLIRTPLSEKPTLVVDPRLAGVPEGVARFLVSAAVLRVRAGLRLAHVFAPEALLDVLAAITMSLDPAAAPLDRVPPDALVVRRLGKMIPKASRGEIAHLCREAFMRRLDPAELCANIERGLLAGAAAACGSLSSGVEALAPGIPPRQFDTVPAALQLVRDVLSEDVITVVDRAPVV
jgi:tetratricopeptide (TPR) repeat protein